ncbi:MAG: hypothetical protein H0A76_12300 [Candidatus Thiodubiliella endoseptemdiera]|uniref:Uncharacterized protein n=1 Tax=Candidatus Thiodubiliella endoseptemdiera TaxID=2738886 RepID=A0A853F8U9_9GAMM|nr:hypothetical protein [Candidatus Thiodubiliella endoseptemdiera]
MDKAMYFKNMAEELTYLKDLIKQEEVQSKLGFAGSEYISDWLSAVAQTEVYVIYPARFSEENLAVTVFTLKASVVLLQTSAFFPAAMRLGVIRTLEGFRQRTLNPKAQDFIKNNLPELVSRKTSLLDLSDIFEKSKMNKYAFSLIKLVDSYVAESVAIAAYVKHATKRGLPIDYTTVDSNLILDIQREVRLTQASPMLKDAPQVYWSRKGTGSNSLNRALFNFKLLC